MTESTQKTLYLATGNAHKIGEFADLLADYPIKVLSANAIGGMPPVAETASDFEGNALLKAHALYARAPADSWVMADDSGLEVDALGGQPGVWSARYAGESASDSDNCKKLLRELLDIPMAQRGARFRCVLVLLGANKNEPLCFSGTCEGKIALAPSGDGGFGYDPLFVPLGHERSFASLAPQIKAAISHRAQAVQEFSRYFSPL